MIVHQLRAGRIHVGDWREADLSPGYTLAIIDGPYAMGMAAWDRMKLDDLADWYAPHLDRLTGLMAPSASVYLWNTAAGWARLDPVMRGLGWTFRALVTWDKGVGAMAGKIDTASMRTWFDVTEVCGFYQREEWAPSTCAGSEIAHAAGSDQRNPLSAFLAAEREASGLTRKGLAAAFPSKSGRLTGCVTNWEDGYNFPTWEVWTRCAAFMQASAPRGDLDRPYLVLPAFWPKGGLRASYDHLRAEYEASRPAFTLPPGVTNVWSAPLVSGAERLKGPDGTALHPCQKPLAFAERMIRASTRPGERVLVPFGGTCREAVVCEWIARTEPEEARGYDVCELNADGRDYIGPVLAQIRGEDTRGRAPGQVRMFGGVP
jgi:hypothetical protein